MVTVNMCLNCTVDNPVVISTLLRLGRNLVSEWNFFVHSRQQYGPGSSDVVNLCSILFFNKPFCSDFLDKILKYL